MNSNKFIWILIGLVNFLLVYLLPTTFDNGDSILHYVEAHQAWLTPHYFMDMWSKPVFILLASPFASFGWYGMKLFNSLCSLGSIYAIKKIIEFWGYNGWFGVILCFFSPYLFLAQSSGLTEPLFMFFLTWIVWLEHENKTTLSLSLLSFLPFIRSEGYIVMMIFLVYLFFTKKQRFVPYILIGTVIYGIVGLFYYHNFFWMFNQNPYAGIEAKYGYGKSFHFIEQLPYVIGLPFFLLVAIGIIRFCLSLNENLNSKLFFLLYGIPIGYIVAHSIFWRFGLFHSFGLTRVLIVIIPFLAFIAIQGLEWLQFFLKFISKRLSMMIYGIFVVVFPLTSSPMAISKEDLSLNHQQVLISQAYRWISDAELTEQPCYTNVFYYAMLSDKIIDNKTEIIELKKLLEKNHKTVSNALILWDSYFAQTDAQVSTGFIENRLGAHKIMEFKNNKGFRLVIYQIP